MFTPTLQGRERAILVGGALVSALSWLAMQPWNVHGWMIGAPLGRDFVNFWMGPRLVLAGQAAILGDLPAYGAAIKSTFGLTRDPGLLFVYPPHAMLVFAPFALMPFAPGVFLWTALNLAALALTTRMLLRGAALLGPALAVCLSPPAVAMVMYGHFDGFLALAATVALTQAGPRPVLSGFCLAFLSTKPQFAAAIGLMLLLNGQWRCLVAGAVATLALVGLSVAVFGIDVWRIFLTVLMPVHSAFITEFNAKMIETSVSAYFAARFSGVPGNVAWAIQGVVSAAALAFGAKALRRGPGEPGTLAVILIAALAMQPYVSHYDLAIAAPAITLLILGRAPGAAPFTVAAWVLMPLARILIVFDLPILGILVTGSLFAQAKRLFRPEDATIIDVGGLAAAKS